MGHWYDFQGNPHHTTLDAKGKVIDTTLRQARKFDWVPSFSAIASVMDKPGLNVWRVGVNLQVAFDHPAGPDESFESWGDRLKPTVTRIMTEARDEGSRIHAALEDSHAGKAYPPQYIKHVQATWAHLERLGVDWQALDSERTFANRLGYGGTVDLCGRDLIIDFKSKDFGPTNARGKPITGAWLAWDENCMQMACYGVGLGMDLGALRAINVFISRTHPGLVVSHQWTADELERGWAIFHHGLKLWQHTKKYFPTPT